MTAIPVRRGPASQRMRSLLGRASIQPAMHWFARLKMGNTFLGHDDFGAGLWISAPATWSHSHGEYPNAAQLHAVAPCHRRGHLIKDGADDRFRIHPTCRCGFISATRSISFVFSTAASLLTKRSQAPDQVVKSIRQKGSGHGDVTLPRHDIGVLRAGWVLARPTLSKRTLRAASAALFHSLAATCVEKFQ